jgi:hypothetical protein
MFNDTLANLQGRFSILSAIHHDTIVELDEFLYWQLLHLFAELDLYSY